MRFHFFFLNRSVGSLGSYNFLDLTSSTPQYYSTVQPVQADSDPCRPVGEVAIILLNSLPCNLFLQFISYNIVINRNNFNRCLTLIASYFVP